MLVSQASSGDMKETHRDPCRAFLWYSFRINFLISLNFCEVLENVGIIKNEQVACNIMQLPFI